MMAPWPIRRETSPWEVALDALPWAVSVAAGAAAWQLRPESRTGPLLVAIGGLFFFGAFSYGRDQALVDLVGFPLSGWFDVRLLVLLVAITPGGLHEGWARVIVTGAGLSHLVLSLDRLHQTGFPRQGERLARLE